MKNQSLIFGIHAVEARLKSEPESINSLHLLQQQRPNKRVVGLLELAIAHNITVEDHSRKALDEMVDGANHQGVIALCHDEVQHYDFKEFLKDIPANCLILVLDGVQDPHNLGACLRSADAAGVDAVIVPKDQAVGITPTVRKVASGAAESVPFYTVTNLSRAMKSLQEQGVWLYGLAGEAGQSLYELDMTGSVALVLGAEGAGLRRLTRENCDELCQIPMQGTVSSLNVSVATGICLFETRRQRIKR